MNTNNCNPNTRSKNKCHYMLDCDNVQDQYPCSALHNPTIFEGYENKLLPTNVCNIEDNTKIFKRMIPSKKSKIIPDIRPGFKICNVNKESTSETYNLKNKMTSFTNINNELQPGKGNKLNYLQKIDIDTNLRNGYMSSLCPEKQHQPIPCTNDMSMNVPNCENHTFNGKVHSDYHEYNNDSRESNILNFSYSDGYQTCMTDINKVNHTLSKLKQPILFQYNNDMGRCRGLQIGPTRTNHSTENIWNNITSRKSI